MAIVELGYNWPCQTEGMAIDLDKVEAHPGDILECYFECDRDISHQEAARVIFKLMETKNNYPGFVLHYAKVETRRITLQYSIAPPGESGTTVMSPWTWWQIVIVVVAIVAAIFAVVALKRGYLLAPKPKTGFVSVTAIGCDDTQCSYPYGLDASFSIAGKTYRTEGGTVKIELPVGTYQVVPLEKSGYQTPRPQNVTIVSGETQSIELRYYKQGVPRPTTGWLVIDTYPVKGVVYVSGIELGVAPQQIELKAGNYVVSFGDVKGYETPESISCTVSEGGTYAINGHYIPVGWPVWAKVAVIVGSAIAASVIVSAMIKATR